MDWRIILVVVIASVVVFGFVILGAVYSKLKVRLADAKSEILVWEEKLKAEKNEAKRLQDLIDAKELNHVEAFEKLSDGLVNLDLGITDDLASK